MSEVRSSQKEFGPNTLMEAVVYFQNPDNCIRYLAERRWSKGEPVCPTCGSKNVGFIASRRMFQCKTRHPKAQFSIKLGTIFEDSPLGLDKWLPAMWLIASNRNGISSWELHRAIQVTQKTAWFMLHRIRLAMQDNLSGGNLGGEVEIDETFIGGKARNMHKDRKRRVQQHGRNTGGKAVVLGMLERGGTVRASVVADRTKTTIQPIVLGNVDKGTEIHSDEHGDSWRMDEDYIHNIVNHLSAYVDGNVHTNGIENFWSLLKRTIGGTYVSVEPFHLFRYVDEQAFRFNNRLPMSDNDRFSYLVRKIIGKRLTYAELTGKVVERQGSGDPTEEPF
jgi:transposase-like protein